MDSYHKKDLLTFTNISLGSCSILAGGYFAYKIYKKIRGKDIDNQHTQKVTEKIIRDLNLLDIDTQNLNTLDQDVREAKIECYNILISTILEYNKKYPNGNFNNFMDIMWKEDYEIMEKSRKNIDGYTRDYSDWEIIFNKIKNN